MTNSVNNYSTWNENRFNHCKFSLGNSHTIPLRSLLLILRVQTEPSVARDHIPPEGIIKDYTSRQTRILSVLLKYNENNDKVREIKRERKWTVVKSTDAAWMSWPGLITVTFSKKIAGELCSVMTLKLRYSGENDGFERNTNSLVSEIWTVFSKTFLKME